MAQGSCPIVRRIKCRTCSLLNLQPAKQGLQVILWESTNLGINLLKGLGHTGVLSLWLIATAALGSKVVEVISATQCLRNAVTDCHDRF